MLQFATFITRLNNGIGKGAAWLCLLIVLLQVAVVLNRYCFGYGSILGYSLVSYEEALLYMFSAIFLFGAAYTYNEDEHVRVDIFYAMMRRRKKMWVDFLGNLILLFPLVGVILIKSRNNLLNSWSSAEGSLDGGLPYVYLWLSMLPLFSILLGMQGIANTIKLAHDLFGKWRHLDRLVALSLALLGVGLAFIAFDWDTEANWSRLEPQWRFGAYTAGVWFVRLFAIAFVAFSCFVMFRKRSGSHTSRHSVLG